MNLTNEQMHILTNGGTITEGNTIYFTLPYKEKARMLYSTRANDYKANHYEEGILNNGEIYQIGENTKIALIDSITKYVYSNFNIDIAKKAYAALPERDRYHCNVYTFDTVENIVNNLFYSDEKPEFVLNCKYHFNFNASDLIDFIIDPVHKVKSIATDLLKRHPEDIIDSFNRYDMVTKAFKAIIENYDDPHHQAKEIIKSITDQKTVHVILNDGRDIKVEARATRGIRYGFEISNYYVIDRHLLDKDQYGHSKDIAMSDIKAIKYKNKLLYTA